MGIELIQNLPKTISGKFVDLAVLTGVTGAAAITGLKACTENSQNNKTVLPSSEQNMGRDVAGCSAKITSALNSAHAAKVYSSVSNETKNENVSVQKQRHTKAKKRPAPPKGITLINRNGVNNAGKTGKKPVAPSQPQSAFISEKSSNTNVRVNSPVQVPEMTFAPQSEAEKLRKEGEALYKEAVDICSRIPEEHLTGTDDIELNLGKRHILIKYRPDNTMKQISVWERATGNFLQDIYFKNSKIGQINEYVPATAAILKKTNYMSYLQDVAEGTVAWVREYDPMTGELVKSTGYDVNGSVCTERKFSDPDGGVKILADSDMLDTYFKIFEIFKKTSVNNNSQKMELDNFNKIYLLTDCLQHDNIQFNLEPEALEFWRNNGVEKFNRIRQLIKTEDIPETERTFDINGEKIYLSSEVNEYEDGTETVITCFNDDDTELFFFIDKY